MTEREIVRNAGVVVPGPEYDDEPLGPVGQEIIYEDDRVRVWHIELPSGGYFGLHKHELDYLIITLQGATCKTWEKQADGTWIEYQFDFDAGDVLPVFVGDGQIHRLFSTDDKTFVNRLVEFKN
jgi:hypothetical protein